VATYHVLEETGVAFKNPGCAMETTIAVITVMKTYRSAKPTVSHVALRCY